MKSPETRREDKEQISARFLELVKTHSDELPTPPEDAMVKTVWALDDPTLFIPLNKVEFEVAGPEDGRNYCSIAFQLDHMSVYCVMLFLGSEDGEYCIQYGSINDDFYTDDPDYALRLIEAVEMYENLGQLTKQQTDPI